MTATFNMRDLSNAIAERFDLTNQSGADIAHFVFDKIKEQLVAGQQVRLHKFGTIDARLRKAGVARNPSTGERLEVPERHVVKLTVSPALKEQIAQNYHAAGEPAADAAVPAAA